MSSVAKPNIDHLDGLLETVEQLRKQKFPHLDVGLVQELLQLHTDPASTASERLRKAEPLVEGRLPKGH